MREGAELVNEAGAWTMSALRSADAAFYEELFGWRAEPWEGVHLLRLDGYVGGEPEQPVPRDLVAVMAPPDGPARWDVDFWVDDVDEAVAGARHAGGTVVAGPYETPIFRQAVLADPDGATFSVSQKRA